MSKTVDELIIQIKADTKQLKKELNKIEGKLKTTGATGGAAFGAIGGASGALAGSLKKLAGPAAIGAVLLGIKELTAFSLRAGMEFEDLKDSLDTVFGSIEEGDKQFKRILTFAQTTPFQIDTVTKAFISLGSVGIEPTTRMMQVFADAASVAVDQRGAFEAMIRVVQRAKAGALGLVELNMLADRGIDVFKGLKEELGLSRLELTAFGSTAEGAEIIVESLVNVLEKQFGGAMVNKMDNLSVSISNMSIAFKSLANEVFQSGLGDFFKRLVDGTTAAVNALAVAIAQMRGEGLGLILAAPQIESDMNFDEKQDVRAKAAQKNIDAITDKIETMVDVADQGKVRQLLTDFLDMPSITPLESQLKLIIKSTTHLGLTAEEADQMIQNLLDALAKEENALHDAQKSEESYNSEKIKGIKLRGLDQQAFKLLSTELIKNKGDTDLLTHATSRLDEIWKKYGQQLIDLGIPSIDALRVAFEELNSKEDENLDKTDKLTVAQQKIQNSFSFVRSKIAGLVEETDKYAFANQNLKQIFDENKEAFEVLGYTSLPQLQAELEKTKDKTEDVVDVLGDELKQAVVTSANAFTTDLVDALISGEDAMDSFESFAKKMVSQIIAIFMQLAVVNKIINSIFGLTGDDALSTIDLLGSGKPKFDTGSWDGNMRGLGGAGGGSMFGGQPRLVGERGAEIFVPHTSGTLLNNMNSKNAMGSGKSVNIYQTVNFATGIVPTVRAEVTKMMPQIADVTKAAVQESAMRGGNFRRSLVGG